MKPPEHHFVDEYGQREVKRLWLGSGVTDNNDVEIFEGDIILLDGKKFVETIDEGSFIIKSKSGEFYYLEPLLGEVVGHIAEEQS